jgi:hypothetical protein
MKLSLNIVSILISLIAIDLDLLHGDRGAGTGTGTGTGTCRVDAFTTYAARVKNVNKLAAKTESTEFEPHPPDSPPPSQLLAGDVPRPFFADALNREDFLMVTQEDVAHEVLNQEPAQEVKLEPEVEAEVELNMEPALELAIKEAPEVVEIPEEAIEPVISEPIISKETQEEMAKMSKELADSIGELVTAELIVSKAHVLGLARSELL